MFLCVRAASARGRGSLKRGGDHQADSGGGGATVAHPSGEHPLAPAAKRLCVGQLSAASVRSGRSASTVFPDDSVSNHGGLCVCSKPLTHHCRGVFLYRGSIIYHLFLIPSSSKSIAHMFKIICLCPSLQLPEGFPSAWAQQLCDVTFRIGFAKLSTFADLVLCQRLPSRASDRSLQSKFVREWNTHTAWFPNSGVPWPSTALSCYFETSLVP